MESVLRYLLILGVVLLAMGGPQPSQAAGPVTVTLKPQNNSGESGTATLSDEGGKTKVVVSVTGQPAGTPQPMHIHKGTCDKLDPKPAYPLSPVVGGKSETTVNASLDDLTRMGRALVQQLSRDGCQVNISIEREVSETRVLNTAGAAASYQATAIAVTAGLVRFAGDDVLMVYDQSVGADLPNEADLNALVVTVPAGTLHWVTGLQGDAADVPSQTPFTLEQKTLAAGERIALGATRRASET